MSNTINVNYMTGMVNSLAKSVSPKTAPSATFGEMLASTGTQVTDMVAISAAGTAEAVSRDDIISQRWLRNRQYHKKCLYRLSEAQNRAEAAGHPRKARQAGAARDRHGLRHL